MEIQKTQIEIKITHFVYPYKYGKDDNYYDLLYSIRSLYKHFKEPFDVTIIGELPDYLDSVTFIESASDKTLSPQVNITNAQIKACSLYDEWVDMNDAIYLIKDTTLEDIKHLYSIGELNYRKEAPPKSYLKTLMNAYTLLKERGKPTVNYASHIPLYFDSKMFLDMVDECNLSLDETDRGVPTDVLYQNLYFNELVETQEPKKANDFRIGFWGHNDIKLSMLYSNLTFNILNFDEKGYKTNPRLKDYLREKFNEKSPLER